MLLTQRPSSLIRAMYETPTASTVTDSPAIADHSALIRSTSFLTAMCSAPGTHVQFSSKRKQWPAVYRHESRTGTARRGVRVEYLYVLGGSRCSQPSASEGPPLGRV